MSERSIVVSATVVTEDQTHAARAAEVLARAAAGLVLEGISINVNFGIADGDE